MWDLFPNLLFGFPTLGRNNFNTIPSTGVTVGTENVTIELPNHAFTDATTWAVSSSTSGMPFRPGQLPRCLS